MPRRKPENRLIDVVLLESNKFLGEKYEVVSVKPIYAKNVLLPHGIAVLATAKALNDYKGKIEAADTHRKKRADSFTSLFQKMQEDGGITIERRANEKGGLYDKIDANDIASSINAIYQIEINDHFLKMKKKIVQAGEYTVGFKYKDLEKEIIVKVKATHTPESKEAKTPVTTTETVAEAVVA